ncbi:MAG: HD domain-containing protein [Spirochaetaceae bacterium]|jgi:putative nucleotidyltransferase with HDIG domain|nr:HD domain-containing protein [Spirochaetaceae bacterium]
MKNFTIHPLLKEIADIFISRGKQIFLVGGAVRDTLRGQESHDWDIATDAVPEEVIGMFSKVIPTGIKHGTVTVRYKGYSLEATTFRTESDYRDGRRPDKVDYAATIEEDLSRRDFTMNAIAVSLPDGVMVDPFDGTGDIRRGIIRCVGNPAERFGEDGLRPLRAVRFAAQLGFDIEETTLAAIKPSLHITEKVSVERIRDEIDRMLASPKPSRAFRLMEETGLLKLLLPELARCRDVDQKGFHYFDALDHALVACDFAAQENASPIVRLAALFHDIGKVDTRTQDADGNWTFYRHEQVSADLSRNILLRFRYPNAVIDTVVHLVREHMFHYEEIWTDAAVRRFVIRVGEEHLVDLYRLRRADAYATSGIPLPRDFLVPLIRRVNGVLSYDRAFSIKDLRIDGNDLMSIGVKSGPYMGIILKELLESVVEDPELNTKEKLLEIAGNLNKRYG